MSASIKPMPEGWERTELNDDEGMWNPLNDEVYHRSDKWVDHYMVENVPWHRSYMYSLGFVPVRKTKPAVPEWAETCANLLVEGDLSVDGIGAFLAENCVPRSDADEMLAALKSALPQLGPSVYHDVAALIERMEGKR